MANRSAPPQTSTDNAATQASPQALGAAPAKADAPPLLEIPQAVTVGVLASLMSVEAIDVIKQLMRAGLMLTINEVVEFETAAMIAQSLGFQVRRPKPAERGPGSLVISSDQEDESQLQPRNPVVTILGHVDHGKTTLLDSIRNSNLTAGEAGGITQHIGAYQVEANGHLITFLDTPGHEAFTAMRARGAQVTDIAILVLAADDGIMPQTLEAIDHIKAAGVPMVVAINKIDRPEADQERTKRQLAEHDLLIEEWGGDVIAVPISALKGEGISELLENILVVAEVGDLKANPNRPARGVVVEAQIDKSRGPVATVLVQTGTLRVSDHVVAGETRGKIRAMLDDHGSRINEAGPSVPVSILGLGGLPQAGDILDVAPDEKAARALTEQRTKEREARRGAGVTLEQVHSRLESGKSGSLDLIIKTDVQGTIGAITGALLALSTEEIRVNVVHAASGSITEPDVLLAVASDAIIVGFNSTPEPGAEKLSRQEDVEIRAYEVIYDLIDDVQSALKGMLAPTYRDIVEGVATVRAVFNVGRRQKAAGIYVSRGRISRGAQIHVLRGNKNIFSGPIISLKHFKDDVREIGTGVEGGLALEGFSDYQEGDVMEGHLTEEVT